MKTKCDGPKGIGNEEKGYGAMMMMMVEAISIGIENDIV